jgi:hypothetical protein
MHCNQICKLNLNPNISYKKRAIVGVAMKHSVYMAMLMSIRVLN